MGTPAEEKKAPRKPPESASCWFVAVVQADFKEQMEVLHWIEHDSTYNIMYILHDKDVFTPDEIAERADTDESGSPLPYFTRTNGDGTQSQFKSGDVKPPHYHLLIQVPKKMRASTLYNRFCELLYFANPQQAFGDRIEACRYLTHEAFRARKKHQYKRSEVLYSKARPEESKQLYNEMMLSEGACIMDTVRTFKQIKDAVRVQDDSGHATQRAVEAFLEQGNLAAIKMVMSRAYFFDKLL